jgi:pimeloyl-ACP methyl ester carboxylesterase
MLRPEQFFEQEGLFLTQPYDQKKIPLVFIHGLMSDPLMWLPVMADIEADPVLRGRYQFWVYAYPTGNPIAYSALELRESLAGVYKVYPRTRDMVIVNHSLGGVITHLQVIDSGDALVRGIFKKNAPEIMALPDDSLVKRGLIFEANPRIDRVVFVAAPHRGAPLAINRLAEFGASFIRLPGKILSDIGTNTLRAAASAAGIKGKFIPTSINGLSPKSLLLISMNTVPMRTPFHSIIGVAGLPKAPLEKTSDTVVPYWSSHQDAALSEKIVPYPHTAMFVKPEATDEIKRILRLHLASTGDGQ